MVAQRGFQYEINATETLKAFGYVPVNFVPAGAKSNQPDLILEHKQETSGCELKMTDASAGSLVLKYVDNSWRFDDINNEDKEKVFITELANHVYLFDRIQEEWKEIPLKYSSKPEMTKRELYEKDRDTFGDIRGDIPASKIEDYYNTKSTYYVNVGTHGFYLFGDKNPLNTQNVPRFAESAKAQYRARVQYKGKNKYQFTFEMKFNMKDKSPFNIAPIDGKSANIIVDKINLNCFV